METGAARSQRIGDGLVALAVMEEHHRLIAEIHGVQRCDELRRGVGLCRDDRW